MPGINIGGGDGLGYAKLYGLGGALNQEEKKKDAPWYRFWDKTSPGRPWAELIGSSLVGAAVPAIAGPLFQNLGTLALAKSGIAAKAAAAAAEATLKAEKAATLAKSLAGTAKIRDVVAGSLAAGATTKAMRGNPQMAYAPPQPAEEDKIDYGAGFRFNPLPMPPPQQLNMFQQGRLGMLPAQVTRDELMAQYGIY